MRNMGLKGIETDFVRKGKVGENEEDHKILVGKIKRATRLEASFDNEKENDNLKRMKFYGYVSEFIR
ncbi:hypothetical protein ACUXZJ_04465 [Flavobacterium sp. TN-1]